MAILHPTRTFPALLPRYVSRFSCVGPACPDNCCTGWTVTLDKKTFNAYRQSRHPELKDMFETSLRRQRSQASELNYGRIEMRDGDHACPMMQDGLCGVHKHMDESHLSHTCFTYPRMAANFGGQVQQALQLSCPEAARQALLAPDAFDFIEDRITVREGEMRRVNAHPSLGTELLHEIRIFCLQLMRTEGLELWQRLAVLGVFCEQLSKVGKDNHKIVALMNEAARLVESRAMVDALAGLKPNHRGQAIVFATLWSGKEAPGSTARQRAVIATVASNLGTDAETGVASTDKLVAAYTLGVQRLPEALAATPHLLDHFILNEMFLHMFPFDAADAYESYLQLVSRFGLLRLMLAAQCVPEGSLPGVDALVETVQAFCRRFRHDPNFARRANEALRNEGWDSLDNLYGFLRH